MTHARMHARQNEVVGNNTSSKRCTPCGMILGPHRNRSGADRWISGNESNARKNPDDANEDIQAHNRQRSRQQSVMQALERTDGGETYKSGWIELQSIDGSNPARMFQENISQISAKTKVDLSETSSYIFSYTRVMM